MAEFRSFPVSLDARARLLATEILSISSSARHREIRIAAGRLAEQILASGGERWQAVKLEDAFAEMVRQRLIQLDSLPKVYSPPRNITTFRRKGAVAW